MSACGPGDAPMEARTYILACSFTSSLNHRIAWIDLLVDQRFTHVVRYTIFRSVLRPLCVWWRGLGIGAVGAMRCSGWTAPPKTFPQLPPTQARTPRGRRFENGCSKCGAGIDKAPFKWVGGMMVWRPLWSPLFHNHKHENNAPEVEIKARLSTLCVYRMATHCATIPPSDPPTKCASLRSWEARVLVWTHACLFWTDSIPYTKGIQHRYHTVSLQETWCMDMFSTTRRSANRLMWKTQGLRIIKMRYASV